MLSTQEVRRDIPILDKLIYMDCAATSPIPRPVLEAMQSYWEECPFNYGRSLAVFKLSKEVNRRCSGAMDALAGLINASSQELVFTKNTTEALNIVTHGVNFAPGDEVIISNIEHQSNFIPWLYIGKNKDVKIKVAIANEEGIVTPEEIQNKISSRTKLISINHASNIFGSIQDVKAIGRIAHDNSARLLIDAAQTVGRLSIDVKDIDCDFLAMCGRKSLMGPQGTGALYGKREALEELTPHIVGGGAADLKGLGEFTFAELPHRFHAGIYNAMGIIGLGRSVEYVSKDIGIERIRSHVKNLYSYLRKEMDQIDSVTTYGPRDLEQQNGVLSFTLSDFDSREVSRQLDDQASIIVAAGSHGSTTAMQQLDVGGTVRVSLQFYNTEQEVDKLISTLNHIGK
ncbi:MAG: aminotransferase class V-fold PLP-dependent enzyme [Candidatus Thorarchaeota archaeon]